MLRAISGDLKFLHEIIPSTEKELLGQENPDRHPLFAAKVPKGLCFVDNDPAGVFFLRFEHIFDMFHFKHLDRSIIRLFVLNQAYLVAK